MFELLVLKKSKSMPIIFRRIRKYIQSVTLSFQEDVTFVAYFRR